MWGQCARSRGRDQGKALLKEVPLTAHAGPRLWDEEAAGSLYARWVTWLWAGLGTEPGQSLCPCGSRPLGPASRGTATRRVPPALPWETLNIASSSSPQRQTEDFLEVSAASPGSYFWFPEKGYCCLFIYHLYFWMGAGKRLFLVAWWVVLCQELKC